MYYLPASNPLASQNIYSLFHLMIVAGKATPVGAVPGITRSVMEKIKVDM